MIFRKAILSALMPMTLMISGAFAQNFEPVPVSEYAEKTGPNTITFLSYPKYYKDAEGRLALVDVNLKTSGDPAWDFQVTDGVWTLRVRADGAFQAEHEGNVFTYRLDRIGVGRGEGFQAFDWGDPVWSNYQVVGDSIRWYDVFPGVDLAVRYIHDILKVDVIMKAALMNEIRSDVKNGRLNADDYLTARFEIPEVWVTGEARQGGESCDLYAERLDVNQPLEFIKDGKVVHKLRPVEAYILDERGEPILTFDEHEIIRTAQAWRLNRNAPGAAEMSANLGDLAAAQEGDVVLDPSMTFSGEGFYHSGDTYDAYMSECNPNTCYGTNTTMLLGYSSGYEYRPILGFCHVSSKLGPNKVIQSATLSLYCRYSGGASSIEARVYKVTQNWYMSDVAWNYRFGPSNPWTNPGGDYDSSCKSPSLTLPTSSNKTVKFDVTDIFNEHYNQSLSDIFDKGFLIKVEDPTSSIWIFNASEHTSNRPVLEVTYDSLENYMELMEFNGLTNPCPDGPGAPVFINNQWYSYIQSTSFNEDNKTISRDFVIKINDSNGLAAVNKDNITNFLLRKNGTGTPTPAAEGTPFHVFGGTSPQFDPITPTPGDWYNRMAAIFANYIEMNTSPTPTPLKIHSYFHAEDTHDLSGQTYGKGVGNYIGHINYARIGSLHSANAIDFTQVDANASEINGRNAGPAIECFASELDWLYPNGTPTPQSPGTPTPVPTYDGWHIQNDNNAVAGVRHPCVFEKGNDILMFYERLLPKDYVHARLTPIPTHPDCINIKKSLFQEPNGNYFCGSTICLAKAEKTKVMGYDPDDPNKNDNPWMKYFDGSFTQYANGGWSSPIVTPNRLHPVTEVPRVIFNSYLNNGNGEYLMLC